MNDSIKSLGYRTDFIFGQTIEAQNNYFVVTTKSNPNYFWGNLILYKTPPQKGDLARWKAEFKKEFHDPRIYHVTLAWDSPEGERGDVDDFLNEDFELQCSVVLTAAKVSIPPKFNDKIQLRVMESLEDFERCIEIQTASASDKLSKKAWEEFSRTSMDQYKKMIEAEKGLWFGAILDDKIVGSLGIFADGDIGRFKVVSTDPEYQRRGVCSTLVYKSARYALETQRLKKLVMVADETYHAAKIYKSVGFRPTEKQIGLCWWDKNRHR